MRLIRKPIVIVGIDPGTTIGYAILNIEGLVVKTGSARGASLHTIIEEITYYRKPVLVGTDKAKCPELVYQFAAKTGSKVVSPYADLLVAEKRVLAAGFETGNDHEADALASALFAHKKYSALFYKINSYLRNEGKENISDEVKRLVILSDGLSIADAIRIVEKREEPPTVAYRQEAPDDFTPTKEDFLRLRERLRKIESEYKTLRESNEIVSGELEKAEKEEEAADRGGLASNKKINRVLRLREKRIKSLDKKNQALIEKIGLLKRFLAVVGEKLLLKRLNDLTYDELLRRDKIIGISEGDVLLVDNPNKYNQKTLDYLKGKVGIIICKNKVNKDLKNNKDFVFLDASKLRIEEEEDFALADREDVEKVKRESNTIVELFLKYKESRKKEIEEKTNIYK